MNRYQCQAAFYCSWFATNNFRHFRSIVPSKKILHWANVCFVAN